MLVEQGACQVTGTGDGRSGREGESHGLSHDLSHDLSQEEEDEHILCTQVVEGVEVGVASEEEGVAGGKEDRKELSEIKKMAEANPEYAKYLMEKRQLTEELKQRSECWAVCHI